MLQLIMAITYILTGSNIICVILLYMHNSNIIIIKLMLMTGIQFFKTNTYFLRTFTREIILI